MRPYYLGLLFAIADWNGLHLLEYRRSLAKMSIVAKPEAIGR